MDVPCGDVPSVSMRVAGVTPAVSLHSADGVTSTGLKTRKGAREVPSSSVTTSVEGVKGA